MSIDYQIFILENQWRDCRDRLKHLQEDLSANHSFIVKITAEIGRIEEQLRILRRQEYDDRNRVDLSDDR